ncbi:putative 3-deoxy-manno-octulosonate-8-phosphatase [Bacteroidales bacterium KA00251]|nr:putative 3-deoxy-manno-octulosonate-8-phosphatase [Bacteroidales bacterium KA00251]
MSSIPYDLTQIKAFVFDVDGVLSKNILALNEQGVPLRTVNVKDGFAIHMALCRGYVVAVITGGNNQEMAQRMSHLGVRDYFNATRNKLADYNQLKKKYGLHDEEVAFVGDDLPDLEVLQTCGLAVAPLDACSEVQEVADYISPLKGGEGVARDLIEQVLRAQGNWHLKEVELDW